MASAALEPINGDTRFYPGHLWVSERADCRLGKCVKATTRQEAIDGFVEFDRRKYWLKGRQVRLWVMVSADDTPTEHVVTI